MRPYTVHDTSCWEDASWILRKGLRTLWNRIINHTSINGIPRVLLRGCVLNSTKKSTNLVDPYNKSCVHTRFLRVLLRGCVLISTNSSTNLRNRIIGHASIHGIEKVYEPCETVHTRYMTRPSEMMRPDFYLKVWVPLTPFYWWCVPHMKMRPN